MPPERKPTNNDRFSGIHENTIRDLGKLPPPDIDFFRKKFEAGEFEPSDAYFIGTWLIHTQSNEHPAEFRRLGLAYLSQAVEFDPKNSRHKWALRHEAIAVQKTEEPSSSSREIKPQTEENFLDYAEIARYREENREIRPKPRKRVRDKRLRRSIWPR